MSAPNQMNSDSRPGKHPRPNVPRSLRRCLIVALGGWLLTSVLLWAQYRLRVLHPWSLSFLILLLVTIGAVLGSVGLGLWRLLRGPRRGAALGGVAVGLLPIALWAALVERAFDQLRRSEIAPTLPLTLLAMAGASFMELQLSCTYPHRQESERLVMFYDDGIRDPEGDLLAMNQHVARLEELTSLPLRAKIYWVRGPLLGRENQALLGLALGSRTSPAGELDQHELAHALLNQHNDADTAPPMLLAEGWAEAQSRDSKALATAALAHRRWLSQWRANWDRMTAPEKEEFLGLLVDPEGGDLLLRQTTGAERISHLHELTGPSWYHRDRGAVYSIGGAFVDFLLRRYGAERFVQLYFGCRPGTFATECWRVYGTDVDTLEEQFWQDVERIADAR